MWLSKLYWSVKRYFPVHLEQRPVTEHWQPPIMRVQCLDTGWLSAWCPPSRRGTLLLCKCRVSSDCHGRAGGAKGLTGGGERAGAVVSLMPRPCGRLRARSWDPLVTCSATRPNFPFGWLLWSDEHVPEHFHFLLSLPVWTRIIKSSF